MPWSSNLTFLVSVDAGSDDPLGAVYKPARGERSLWDFPDRLYRREVAAFALSEALGWGLVPPTVVREDGPFGEGSLQLFVDADYSQHYFTLFDEGGHEEALRTMCAFDVVANNADRKSGHVLRGPDDRLWAIDHGLCFHRQPKLRTVIWDFAEEPVADDLLEDLATRGRGPSPTRWRGLLSGPEIGRPRGPDRRPGRHRHLPRARSATTLPIRGRWCDPRPKRPWRPRLAAAVWPSAPVVAGPRAGSSTAWARSEA